MIAGGAGAAALGTMTGIYVIGSLFGVAGAGLTGKSTRGTHVPVSQVYLCTAGIQVLFLTGKTLQAW